MDFLALSLFVILELAAVLGLAVFILNKKYNRLQVKCEELSQVSTPPAPEAFESITSGYLPYLEKTILESRTRLESAENDAGSDNTLVEAIRYRLSLLETEKQVIERCNDYPENRWQHVAELFVPPETPDQEDQESIESLVKFRDHFFNMKKQLGELTESKQKLVEQLEALIPESERSDELRALVETLNTQRDRLQDELSQLESQSDELTRSAAQQTAHEEEPREDQRADDGGNASELQEQIEKQKRKISELEHLIDDLKVEDEKTRDLQTKVDQFDLANRDMDMCIKVLEEENEFLQEQIKALLKLDDGETVYHSDEPSGEEQVDLQKKLEAMQTTLDEKDQKIKTLEEKYAAMEKEYLTLYEETNS